MRIFQKVKGVIMRNLCDTIFLDKGECIARFSYLHECTFKIPAKLLHALWSLQRI